VGVMTLDCQILTSENQLERLALLSVVGSTAWENRTA
jgi:hypothetical protein